MRIQHNIMAMNAYRNYTSNTKALSKNLEKLSSGYKINRAGDDAAGLAISEKMRAQITGLKTAQKNAKDGISLVQTAEGALTEAHSMLNRMVELAGQSANGTYDNAVDRANLQKEFDALRSEIDRIADSSNFNGIKLLDGSLGGGTAGGAVGVPAFEGEALGDPATTVAGASSSVVDVSAALAQTTDDASGKTLSYTFHISDGTSVTIDLEVNAAGTELLYNGEKVGEIAAGSSKKPTAVEQGKALAAALGKSELKGKFKVEADGTSGDLTFTSKAKGADAATVISVEAPNAGLSAQVNTGAAITKGTNAYDTTTVARDKVFTVGGQKFMLASTDAIAAAADPDVTVVVGALDADGLGTLASVIEQKTGYKPTVNAGGTGFEWKSSTASGGAGNGLTLQIGDTSDPFNQLTVSVGDMHCAALGISGLSISTQATAQAAVETLKNAINSVSSTRGGLGALQNRLEHTINNLSVMQENIQDAEATIRDVDVAEEMMAYTKNNILVQSAQAMLAQANQIPQGVLQLLQ